MLATAPDDAVVLRPPPPGEAVADVAAAVRDALRFPLAGDGLEVHARRGTRATIVIESPRSRFPARRTILARMRSPRSSRSSSARHLDRIPDVSRRLGSGAPRVATRARDVRYTGARPPLPRERGRARRRRPRARPTRRLVTSTVAGEPRARRDRSRDRRERGGVGLHGGPAALLAASGADALRAAGAYSLLETTASQGWHLAVSLERALAGACRCSACRSCSTIRRPRAPCAAIRTTPLRWSGSPRRCAPLRRVAGDAAP